MTQEELNELFQRAINDKDTLLPYKKAAENGDNSALQVLQNLIQMCSDLINQTDDVYAACVLIRCNSTVTNASLLNLVENCIKNKIAQNKQGSPILGALYLSMFLINPNIDYDYMIKYCEIVCHSPVFSNDNSLISTLIKPPYDEKHVSALCTLVNLFAAGCNGPRAADCAHWLTTIGNNALNANDCDELLFTLYSYESDPSLKWTYFVKYFENTENHTEIIDSHFSEITQYFAGNLIGLMERYLPGFRYRLDYDKDVELLNEMRNATIDDARDPIQYLRQLKYINSKHPHLGLLQAVTQYDKLSPKDYFTSLFDNYRKFISIDAYPKLQAMKNPVIDALLTQIQNYLHLQGTDTVLSAQQLSLTTFVLRQQIDNIAQTIADVTLYSNFHDVRRKLINISLEYSFERKITHNEGAPEDEIQSQVDIVYDMLCMYCPEKRPICDHCRLKQIKSALERYLFERNPGALDTLLNILLGTSEERIDCVNKQLLHELLVLKKMLMDRSFDSPVFGEYCDSEHKIILYLGNIYDAKEDVLSTYAHELFHAYHAACVKEKGNSWDYNTDPEIIVIESLASYFENVFANQGCNYCSLPNHWLRHTIYAWPYAGAKHLIPYGGEYSRVAYPSNVLFRYVFEKSLDSFDKAFKKISFGEKMLFEDFKNNNPQLII